MTAMLCGTCENRIYCETWGENKCKAKKTRIYSFMPVVQTCSDYKKRGKNFKEPKCQCKDCLMNEKLYEDED